MDFNSDFRYDLQLGQLGEELVAKLLKDKTIEVKFDFGTHRTGNFYIEYESRGKPSGIATTQAKYWMLIAASATAERLKTDFDSLEDSDVLYCVLIETSRLKDLCRNHYHRKDVPGGDNNTSRGVLIKASTLLRV